MEPGPELCQLERRILEHDEALAPAPPSPVPRSPPPRASGPVVPAAGPRPSRRAWRWAVAAAIVTAVVLVATLLSVPGRRASLDVATDTNMLVAITGTPGHATERMQLPDQPGAIAVAGGAAWVASPNAGALLEVDQEQGVVVDRIPIEGEPGSLVSGGGALWVSSTLGATVDRIDPVTATVAWTTQLAETGSVAMAYGTGHLWVADSSDQAVLELSPLTGSVLQTFSLDVHPTSIAFADGLVWVAAYDASTVEAIDPTSGQTVGTVTVGKGPSAISFSNGDLWVANNLDSTVSLVDAATFTVASIIAVGSGPVAVVASPSAVWVANQYSGTVSRISPQTLAVVGTVDVGSSPVALAPGPGEILAAAAAPAGHDRGGTLVLVSTDGGRTIDPSLFEAMPPLSFLRLEYDTLVTFEPVPGPNGLRLVPDLALQVPAPSDGGRTYSFRLRPGIRYSNGELLKASDFRRALERLFDVGSPGATYYSGLVGAQACAAHRENCNLSQGVVTEDRSGLVVFHLSAPDPDFLDKLTPNAFGAPVPSGIPDRDMGLRPIAGTGPYRIVSATASKVVFERNPYFREWSHAAQPQGRPNKIVWLTPTSEQGVVNDIEQGKADWTWDSIPVPELHALEVEHPSQVRSSPSFVVEFIPLNANVPPFNNLLARQALNYAIDRDKIAQMYGRAHCCHTHLSAPSTGPAWLRALLPLHLAPVA